MSCRQFTLAVAASLMSSMAFGCGQPVTVCFEDGPGRFALVQDGRPALVLRDDDADSAVLRVADSFAQDLSRVSGRRARASGEVTRNAAAVVVVGVVGDSALLDGLVTSGKLDVSGLAGRWEGFQITVVDNPWPQVRRALVVAGSDRRGAVFGTYDLSERMGVSPWHWFADVPIEKHQQVWVSGGTRREQPGVRYRGIFINDEAPAFSGWAEKKFGGVNADVYEHVFELLLRLKANYLWPAMWSPRSFHLDDPRSRKLADSMGIVMGTSHHEPLTRAQTEWHRLPEDPTTGGDWDYQTNGENLRKFWRGGLERMMEKGGTGYENLLTIGMRGDGDLPMAQGTAIALLERIVADQRQLIEEVTGRPATEVPQVWALYKEVQDYYDQGMTVPDDVTLLFADDNWGQIRRLPTRNTDRKGGFGVYYHFEFVGAPRNYKWINTNQIEKVWQQMDLAWQRGARNLWVVNVGDIKPMEYPIDFFLRMAWSPEAMTPEALEAYPAQWAERQFGAELAPAIGSLITNYSRLAARRKPEFVNETTYAVGEVRPDVLVRGEFSRIVGDWRTLVAELEAVKPRVPKAQADAFFQLVAFPIEAVSNLYEMYFATAWNRRLASSHDARANFFQKQVEAAFARDAELARQYHALNGGKWDQMMSQVHMNYVIWNDPTEQTMPVVTQVAADVPVAMRNPAVTFVDAQPAAGGQLRAAASFDRSVGASGLQWQSVKHLGQSGAALVAMPQGRPATEAGEGPRVEYDFTVSADQKLAARLQLAPTLDTIGSTGVRIGVSLDDGPVQVLVSDLEATGGAANTAAKRRWYDAVTDNRVRLEARFDAVPAGRHTLKVWRLDDNVVLEGVQIEPLRGEQASITVTR